MDKGIKALISKHIKTPAVSQSTVKSEAIFDKSGVHRFILFRRWDLLGKKAVAVGLNPSYADCLSGDKTTMELMNYLW